MRKVSAVARRGSFVAPAPLPKKTSGRSSRSWPIAWRMRGAPRKLPSAELSVAAKTPATTRGARTLIACRARKDPPTISSRGTAPAMSTSCVPQMAGVKPMAASVPHGIERWELLRSPDRFAPAVIPVAAGKRSANAAQKSMPSP